MRERVKDEAAAAAAAMSTTASEGGISEGKTTSTSYTTFFDRPKYVSQ